MTKSDGQVIPMGPGLKLPIETILQRKSILAKTGAGKSNTACVYVEGALDLGVQTIVIDPKGDWWGLRSNASGRGEGYPVLIMGGDHADVPLDPKAGTMVGKWLAETPVSVVLDVSEFSDDEMPTFIADFADSFYRNKKRNKTPVLLVLEEVDEYCPETKDKRTLDLGRCIKNIARLAKRARFLGVGILCVTLRSASFNKNVLGQTDILIVMRTTSPHDVQAVTAWFDGKDIDDQAKRKEVLGSIRKLQTGEGFVYGPEAGIFKRLKFSRRRTFDSGVTPGFGKKMIQPKVLAPVEIDDLRREMKSFIEQAEAEDPARLKEQVAALKREKAALAKQVESAKAHQETRVVEKPVLSEEDVALVREAGAAFEAAVARVNAALEPVVDLVNGDMARHAQAMADLAAKVGAQAHRAREGSGTNGATRVKAAPVVRSSPSAGQETSDPVLGAEGEVVEVSGPMQRVLDALAWLEATNGDRAQQMTAVAFMAGYKPNGGAFNNPKSRLRVLGLVDYPKPGFLALTDEGRARAAVPEPVLTTAELQDRVKENLTGPMQRVLQPLLDAYPESMTSADCAAQAGYEPNGGAFNNPKSRLKTLGLIDYPGPGLLVAKPVLFLEETH